MNRDPRLPLHVFSFGQRFTYGFFQFLDHFLSRRVVVKLFGRWRYRAFESVKRTLEANGPGQLIPVERRKSLSIEEFHREYLMKGIPVVIEGAALNWPCTVQWTPENIREMYGEDEVPMLDAVYLENGVKYIKLRQIIDEILEGKNTYFRFYNLLARHPERIADFDLEWLRKMKHKRNYTEFFQVFIGGAHSRTAMHNAHADNLFVQVHGEKEWILYPHYFAPLIDPPSTLGGTYRIGPKRGEKGKPFDPYFPDYETYPLYKYIHGYHVILKPGDVFYNPPYMWHTVRNNSSSIGIGYRWTNALSAFRNGPLYYILDLCAYRPSYFRAYRWYKKDSNAEFVYLEKQLRKQREKQERKKKKAAKM